MNSIFAYFVPFFNLREHPKIQQFPYEHYLWYHLRCLSVPQWSRAHDHLQVICPGGWSFPGLATNSAILFCFLFVKKLMTPSQGNTFILRSSQQLPRLCFGPLKCFLSCHGPRLASGKAFRATNKQGHHQVCRARHGGPRTPKKCWCKPELCVCWNRTFYHRSLILKSQQKRIELVTRPGGH